MAHRPTSASLRTQSRLPKPIIKTTSIRSASTTAGKENKAHQANRLDLPSLQQPLKRFQQSTSAHALKVVRTNEAKDVGEDYNTSYYATTTAETRLRDSGRMVRAVARKPVGSVMAGKTLSGGTTMGNRNSEESLRILEEMQKKIQAQEERLNEITERPTLDIVGGEDIKESPIYLAIQSEKIILQEALVVERRSFETLEKTLLEQKAAYETIVKESMKLKSDVEHNIKKLDHLCSHLENIQTSMSVLEADKSMHQGEIEKVRQQCQQLEVKFQSENYQVIQKYQEEIDQLTHSLKSYSSSRNDLEDLMDKAQVAVSELEYKLKEKTELLRNAEKEEIFLQAEIIKLDKEQEACKSAIEEMQNSWKVKRNENENLRQELELEFQALKSELAALHNKQRDYQAQKFAQISELKALNQRLESLKNETGADIIRSTQECQRISENIEQQKLQIRKLETSLSQLKRQVYDEEVECKNLGNQILIRECRWKEQDRMIKNYEQQIESDQAIRRKHRHMIQELKGNIRVFCRVRPSLNVSSAMANDTECQPGLYDINSKEAILDVRSDRKYQFGYDYVFGPESSQQEVFDEVRAMIESGLACHESKSTIFMYGSRTSGKTYTTLGSVHKRSEYGLLGNILEYLLESKPNDEIDRNERHSIILSAMEVDGKLASPIDLVDDSNYENPCIQEKRGGFEVQSLFAAQKLLSTRSVQINSREAVQTILMQTSESQRCVGSHRVYHIQMWKGDPNCKHIINLIDLAPSDKKTTPAGDVLHGTMIKYENTCLHTFSRVIGALSNRDKHIPYGECPLTAMLETSISRGSRMLMIVTISPEAKHLEESLHSLKYASKMNSCDIGREGVVDKGAGPGRGKVIVGKKFGALGR